MDKLILVEAGKPCFQLAFDPPQDADRYLSLIADFRHHLEAALQVVPAWPMGAPVGTTLCLQVDPLCDLSDQAFEIFAQSERLTILAGGASGLAHGVYYFLEEAFGVRWLWPGDDGTVIPKANDVSWPLGRERHAPDWTWRRLGMSGSFYSSDPPLVAERKVAGLSQESLQSYQTWCRRNRLGGPEIADGHRWIQICPPQRYGESHPEYFALVDGERDCQLHNGKHGNQLCTSNPAVIELVARYTIALFDRQPELAGFSISPNDGGGFCECESCQALDTPEVGTLSDEEFQRATAEAPGAGDSHAITDRMFAFANAVAERVAAVHSKKLLLLLVYGSYRTPPRVHHLHPNVIAQFCTMTWSHRSPEIKARDLGLIAGVAKTVNHLGFYDYFVNGSNGGMPRGFWRHWLDSAKQYHAMGGRFFATQSGMDFALGGFGYYLAAKALWHSDIDFDTVLADYCDCGFGAAASVVQRYLEAYMERWDFAISGCLEEQVVSLYPVEWRTEQRQKLEAAKKQADAALARRLVFLLEGLTYLDLLAGACEVALQDAPPPDAGLPLQAWLDDHADGFWCAAMWHHYYLFSRQGKLKSLFPPL